MHVQRVQKYRFSYQICKFVGFLLPSFFFPHFISIGNLNTTPLWMSITWLLNKNNNLIFDITAHNYLSINIFHLAWNFLCVLFFTAVYFSILYCILITSLKAAMSGVRLRLRLIQICHFAIIKKSFSKSFSFCCRRRRGCLSSLLA